MAESLIEQEIHATEKELHKLRQKIINLHHKIPDVAVKYYQFEGPKGKVSLSDLFEDKDEMIMIHNMGQSCAYCTLWADGFNGFTDHLNSRLSFVLSTGDDFKSFSTFAEDRGWRFRYYSTQGFDFQKDMGFFGEHSHSGKEGPFPGLSYFYKKDGEIFRSTRANLGPGDQFCSIWHMLDLTKDGINNWQPKFKYDN